MIQSLEQISHGSPDIDKIFTVFPSIGTVSDKIQQIIIRFHKIKRPERKRNQAQKGREQETEKPPAPCRKAVYGENISFPFAQRPEVVRSRHRAGRGSAAVLKVILSLRQVCEKR